MKLTINGNALDTDSATLSDLLTALDYEGEWLATAVNGELVHREKRATQKLAEGDRIEILSPMQGG